MQHVLTVDCKSHVACDSFCLRDSRGSIRQDLGLTPEQMECVTRAFRMIDSNGNGLISKVELEQASRVLGYNLSRREVEKMIASVDEDGNGQIDFREFATMMRDQFGALEYQEMAVREAFQLLDKDGNGFIDYEELRQVLLQRGDSLSEEEFQRVVDDLDVNKDGKIEYEGVE
ncbi:neo-calmodulin-like [Babylonia areolata]|uniref:neo-calmodulin-like n=1 Tax=Babylonia areolata TaxID=304850 RepID=UPI003FD52DC8